GCFFSSRAVNADSVQYYMGGLRARFAGVARSLGSETDRSVDDPGQRPRVVILVSKEGLCLYDLLGRVASGELAADVRAVIGNHDVLADITQAHGIPFHHVPFDGDDAKSFEQIAKLVDEHDPHAEV